MGRFGGVGSVQGRRAPADYFKKGDYLLEIERVTERISTHPDTEGEQKILAFFKVAEVLTQFKDPDTGEDLSSKVGDRLISVFRMERAPSGKLKQKGEYAMGRFKQLIAASLGYEDSDIDEEACEAVVDAGEIELDDGTKQEYGAGEALSGQLIKARARDVHWSSEAKGDKPARSGVKTEVDFIACDEEAEAAA